MNVTFRDDIGFEKKGACSAWVQRQYTRTAGKITNYQAGVFLARQREATVFLVVEGRRDALARKRVARLDAAV